MLHGSWSLGIELTEFCHLAVNYHTNIVIAVWANEFHTAQARW